jgi:hypothetical protein
LSWATFLQKQGAAVDLKQQKSAATGDSAFCFTFHFTAIIFSTNINVEVMVLKITNAKNVVSRVNCRKQFLHRDKRTLPAVKTFVVKLNLKYFYLSITCAALEHTK